MDTNKLEEIIQEVVQEESPPSPKEVAAPPEPEAPKKKRVATEKQLAALAKGRETRAKNKKEKEWMKEVKLKMLEKIHQRVESFDMSALMNKIDRMTSGQKRQVFEDYDEPKPRAKPKKIETPEIEEESEEEENDPPCDCFFTSRMKPTVHDTGEYDFFCK